MWGKLCVLTLVDNQYSYMIPCEFHPLTKTIYILYSLGATLFENQQTEPFEIIVAWVLVTAYE